MTAIPAKDQVDRIAMYGEMQRALPGLSDMYDLAAALIVGRTAVGNRLLISGAGGGREIEALGAATQELEITAVDPSEENLELTKRIARECDAFGRITFVGGAVENLPHGLPFDVATSLLVMHHLRDDGAKLGYLKALKDRLSPGGILIHADVCHDGAEDIEDQVSAYLAHAGHVGVSDDVTRIETEAITRMPIVSSARVRTLLVEAGFTPPREVFRSLWYRCWTSACAGQ